MPDPDPVLSLSKGGESSQWWRYRHQTHGSGKEAPAVPELRAGWLAMLMPDPVLASDRVPDTPMPGEAVAAAAVPRWEVTGVATAAQRSEEGGVIVAGTVGDYNVTDEES